VAALSARSSRRCGATRRRDRSFGAGGGGGGPGLVGLAQRGPVLDELQDAEQFPDAADQQPLLLDLDPGAGGEREHDVIAGGDRHLYAGLRPPVKPAADSEHDPVLRRWLVCALWHHEAGLPDPVGLELLDHHAVEKGAERLSHQGKG
jgi:hypothetical protein